VPDVPWGSPKEEEGIMGPQLSPRLGPRAKRIALRASGTERVSGLVQVAPSADRRALQAAVEGHGGLVRSWNAPLGLVTVEVSARDLNTLADLDGVLYVEAGEPYRPAAAGSGHQVDGRAGVDAPKTPGRVEPRHPLGRAGGGDQDVTDLGRG
jgi:hypothetical protein